MSFCRVDVKVCVVAVPRDSNLAVFRIDVGQRILHDFNRDEPAHLLVVGVDDEPAAGEPSVVLWATDGQQARRVDVNVHVVACKKRKQIGHSSD